jgi:tRNA threonylcarbamoyladenosine biosynthesis protein TsaE
MEMVFTLTEIKEAAAKFWQAIADKKVIAFHGKMGAGKTTFIHALCDVKGVTDPVSSPTFSIINEYRFMEKEEQQKIFHIDLYRLKDAQEAIRAGVEDCLFSNQLCLVEWPERALVLFPADSVHVFIEPAGDNTRIVRIGKN